MTTKTIQRGLWGVAGVCGVLSLAALGWGLFTSLDEPEPTKLRPVVGTSVSAPPPSLPPIESFAVIWEGERQPEPEPEPVQVVPVETPQNVPIQLLATAVENGRSIAVLLNDRNQLEVRGEGDYSSGVKLVRILGGRVEAEQDGRRFNLSVPKQYGGPGGYGGDYGGGRQTSEIIEVRPDRPGRRYRSQESLYE